MRKTFFEIIQKEDVYILTADLGQGVIDFNRKKTINVGVAEQNMIGIAAGLALSGEKVYCYTIAPFFLRAYEQIRVDICHHNLPVILIGSIGYEKEGYTHHYEGVRSAMDLLSNIFSNRPRKEDVEYLARYSLNYGPLYIELRR